MLSSVWCWLRGWEGRCDGDSSVSTESATQWREWQRLVQNTEGWTGRRVRQRRPRFLYKHAQATSCELRVTRAAGGCIRGPSHLGRRALRCYCGSHARLIQRGDAIGNGVDRFHITRFRACWVGLQARAPRAWDLASQICRCRWLVAADPPRTSPCHIRVDIAILNRTC